MPVPASLGQLSQTASMNSPAGGENVFPDQDDYERQQFANDAILRDGAHQWLTGVSGTNTVTGSTAAASAVSAYAAGQAFRFVAAGANTGAVTLNVNGLGAKAVTKRGATALAADDIAAGSVVTVVYDGTQFQMLDPADAVQTGGNQTVAGVKTFTSPPVVPTATASNQAVNKGQAEAMPGRLLAVRYLTGSGTYTPTAGAASYIAEGVGGGAAGGGCFATSSGQLAGGSGGGSGAFFRHSSTSMTPVSYSCGAGGVGSAGGSGGDGGDTTFGPVTAPGGKGGVEGANLPIHSTSMAIPTPAAAASTGASLINAAGTSGLVGLAIGQQWFGGAGASSPLGVGGGTTYAGIAAAPGTGFGAGGAGACAIGPAPSLAGASGAPGGIVVYEYS